MDYRTFSKKDLVEIMELIQSAVRCKNELDVKRLLERTKELVCADYSIAGLGVYDNKGLAEAKNIINGSYPEGWFAAYKEEKLYAIDPIVGWHYKFFGTQIWEDIYKRCKNTAFDKFIHNANNFGLCFGIASSIPSRYNNLASIISFAGNNNCLGAHQKAILDILIPHFHQALIRMCRGSEKKPAAQLTAREKEVLKWVKEGKTNWEISMILNISERTVRDYVDHIKDKLDILNRSQIAAIAMEQEEGG